MGVQTFDPGLERLLEMFSAQGCTRLYAKKLVPNDNTKNQVYFAGNFNVLNILPISEVRAGDGARPIFKASVSFGWLLPDGRVANAPGAQLILYPQYPEVRFSGFLNRCDSAPSHLMTGRIPGRVLFLGVAGRLIIGFVAAPASVTASEYMDLHQPLMPTTVFSEITLPSMLDEHCSRAKLLSELRRINGLGWIESKQLDSHGVLKPCRASQCGGFTLEAELGISKNSVAGPDFHGWEVKQHRVTNFERPASGTAITLMTPEPTGGFYREEGVEAFIRRYGYPDKNDKPDRLNFGGIYRVGQRVTLTGLTMIMSGYDLERNMITGADGAVALVSDDGIVAASWSIGSLLSHWSRKHERAVYVPSMCSKTTGWKYRFGHLVRLASRADPIKFIHAFATGLVYYDPGIKLECISTQPRSKRRSQFRIKSSGIDALYEMVEVVDLRQ